MNNTICNSEHRYSPKFDDLQDDQSKPPRHKCCGCAYEQGLNDGSSGRLKKPDVDSWPKSQAGTVRHKDAIEAYNLGYAEGEGMI